MKRALLLIPLVTACATTTKPEPEAPLVETAPVEGDTREAKEKRLARVLRESEMGLLEARKAEMESLLFELAGLEGPPRSREEGARVQEVMVEVVKKHDPELAEVMKSGFERYRCRALQAEAKMNLRSLHVAEEAHRAEHDAYSADLDAIGFTPRGEYSYRATLHEGGFRATATNHPGVPGDAWSIDQDGALVNDLDGCPAPRTLTLTDDDRAMLRDFYLETARADLAAGLDEARAKTREGIATRLAGVDSAFNKREGRKAIAAQHEALTARLSTPERAAFAPIQRRGRCLATRGRGPEGELRRLYSEVESFRSEHGAPPRAPADLRFEGELAYSYGVRPVEGDPELGYYLLAEGTGALEGDVWAMGSNLELVHLRDCGAQVVDEARVVDALRSAGR